MTRRQLIIARILFALYLIAVAVLCFGKFDSSQDVPADLWGLPMDKVVHFLMFFPFPVLAYLAFDRFTERWWTSVLWTMAAFLAGCLLAAGTEIIQARFLPYRAGDFTDFVADLLALTFGSAFVLYLDLRKQRS